MSDTKRPKAFEVTGDEYFDTYEAYDKTEADVLFAALERRLRISERALDLVALVVPMVAAGTIVKAQREIDAEIKQKNDGAA